MKPSILFLVLPLAAASCRSAEPAVTEPVSSGTPTAEPSSGDTTRGDTTPAAEPATLTDLRWELVQLNGEAVRTTEVQKEAACMLMEIEARRVTGFGGCNRFFGTYRLRDGGELEFSQMVATRMACPGVEVDESAFLKMFTSVEGHVIDGDELLLKGAEGATLAVFRAAAPAASEATE
ncbi:META domain-containing protein [Saltatorellus ferox]